MGLDPKILSLPGDTRLFSGHDYKAPGREQFAWESTVAAQQASNQHVGGGTTQQSFVSLREARDQELSEPRRILPSLQVNMRAGATPPTESNGVSYFKLPVNRL